jgi:hypothetical protein
MSENKRFCAKCGGPLRSDAEFCVFCGQKCGGSATRPENRRIPVSAAKAQPPKQNLFVNASFSSKTTDPDRSEATGVGILITGIVFDVLGLLLWIIASIMRSNYEDRMSYWLTGHDSSWQLIMYLACACFIIATILEIVHGVKKYNSR